MSRCEIFYIIQSYDTVERGTKSKQEKKISLPTGNPSAFSVFSACFCFFSMIRVQAL